MLLFALTFTLLSGAVFPSLVHAQSINWYTNTAYLEADEIEEMKQELKEQKTFIQKLQASLEQIKILIRKIFRLS